MFVVVPSCWRDQSLAFCVVVCRPRRDQSPRAFSSSSCRTSSNSKLSAHFGAGFLRRSRRDGPLALHLLRRHRHRQLPRRHPRPPLRCQPPSTPPPPAPPRVVYTPPPPPTSTCGARPWRLRPPPPTCRYRLLHSLHGRRPCRGPSTTRHRLRATPPPRARHRRRDPEAASSPDLLRAQPSLPPFSRSPALPLRGDSSRRHPQLRRRWCRVAAA